MLTAQENRMYERCIARDVQCTARNVKRAERAARIADRGIEQQILHGLAMDGGLTGCTKAQARRRIRQRYSWY